MRIFMTKKVALAVSAHADDAHAALGGTIRRLLDEGEYEIHYVAFSIAEESVPEGFPKDIVAKECVKALQILGVDEKFVEINRFPVRKFPQNRQDILEKLVSLRKDLNPGIVFIPSTEDIHQDHEVVSEEGIRAFRRSSTLLGYDFPWNVLYGERLDRFYEISQEQLERKINSLQAYESQIVKENNCLTPNYVRSLAVERGQRINVPYAEAFETIRDVRFL